MTPHHTSPTGPTRSPRERSHFGLALAALPLAAVLACSGANKPGEDAGSGGTSGQGAGGVTGSGGQGASGGAAAGAGGSAGSGGGQAASGGADASGGQTSSGGQASSGGQGSGSGGAETGSGGAGGGASGGAGSGGQGSGGGPGGEPGSLAEMYPCDGEMSGYDAVVTGAGTNWSVSGGGSHGSLLEAMRAALGSGGASASAKRKVLLAGDGTVPANEQLRVFSNTVLNVCGTITVVDPTGGSDRSPIYARGASNIDIPHLAIRGNAQYGAFFRETENVHIGVADIRLSGGLGIRIDNNPGGNDWANSASNAARRSGFRLDDVYVENVSHGVEFYGIRDITIGRVVARSTTEAGLMLNNSVNVEVELVDGKGVSPNAGYAVFRMANDNGKDWDSGTHPMNIHVKKVIARESGGQNGQGIFCLTDSGGVTIDEVDLENTASNAVWLEWCTNVRIGTSTAQSRIVNSGNFMVSYGTDTRRSNQLVFENITLTGTNINFNHDCPPEIQWINVTRNGAAVTQCQ